MTAEAPALLAVLGPVLPLLGGGLTLFGVVVVGLLVLYLKKVAAVEKAMSSAAAVPPALVPAAPAPAPVAPEPMTVENRLDETFETLRRTIEGARGTATPWVAMIGPAGAGISSALRDAGPVADVAEGLPGDRLRSRSPDDLGWWFFDSGMVIDVPAGILAAEHEAEPDRLWTGFLNHLCAARPRRPLDGIVLALPVQHFIGPSAKSRDDLLARGRALHTRLWQLQERVGFRLPLYVLLTGCEAVTGFGDFWTLQAPDRRQEMFGWSNPANADAAYDRSWLEAAFDAINDQLFRVQTHTAGAVAAGAPEVGGMVLFPGAVNTIRPALESMFGPLFEPTAYHESVCLRGLWLCGRLPQAGSEPGEGVGGRTILVRQLLRRKVFPERGLARPTARGARRSSTLVRRLKWGLAGVAAVLCIGLIVAAVDFSRQVDRLDEPLGALQQAIHVDVATSALGTTTRVEDARHLLNAMQALQETDLVEVFMPTTWVSTLRSGMVNLLAEGVGTAILGAMHSVLEERGTDLYVNGILSPDKVAARMAEGRPRALAELIVWVEDSDQLTTEIAMFNALGKTGGVEHLPDLAKDMLGIELQAGVTSYNDLFTASIAKAKHDPILISVWRPKAQARLRTMTTAALDSLTETGDLALVLTDLQSLLATPGRPLTKAQAHVVSTGQSGSPPDVFVQQLTPLIARLRVMMSRPWWQSVTEGQLRTEGLMTSLLSSVARNTLFGPELATELSNAADRDLAAFRTVLQAFGAGAVRPFLVSVSGSQTLTVAPGLTRLGDQLDGLAGQPFMALVNGAPPAAQPIQLIDGRMIWTTATLVQALDLYRSYATWQAAEFAQIPGSLAPVLRDVTRDRLDGQMTRLVNLSLTPLPAVDQDPEARGSAFDQLRADIDAFAPAVQPLAELQAAFDAIVRPVSRDTLRQASQRAAYDLLQRLDDHLTAVPLYQPVRAAATWNGGDTLTGLMYGAPDAGSMAVYLQGQRQRADTLANSLAGPPLEALRMVDVGSVPAWLSTLGRWRGLQAQVTAAVAGQPSTIAEIEAFLTGTLVGLTQSVCEERLSLIQPASPTGDYILGRRDAVLDAVWSRCDELNGGSGVMAGAYTRVARLFNATMAGRYPFASSPTGSGVADVTPAELHSYLVEWDSARASLEAEVNAGSVSRGARSAAMAFIASMDAARAFLGPFASTADVGTAAYDLAVQFRVNRAYEVNANQILGWQVMVGGTSITPATATTSVKWVWNQPVSVTLTWAKDSPDLPFPRNGLRPAVVGTTVTFRYDDPWALLSFLRDTSLQNGQFDPGARPVPVIAVLSVPTRPANATAPALPADPGTASTAAQTTARAFLHVALSAPGKDGAPGPALAIPAFPVVAPLLSGEGTSR